MGMFDSVLVDCPHCDTENDLQTKVGHCLMNSYDLNEDMVTTLGVLGVHTCYNCKKKFRVKLLTKPLAEVEKIDE